MLFKKEHMLGREYTKMSHILGVLNGQEKAG